MSLESMSDVGASPSALVHAAQREVAGTMPRPGRWKEEVILQRDSLPGSSCLAPGCSTWNTK